MGLRRGRPTARDPPTHPPPLAQPPLNPPTTTRRPRPHRTGSPPSAAPAPRAHRRPTLKTATTPTTNRSLTPTTRAAARVAGRVVAVTPAGARVTMLADDRVVGFCAASEAGPPRGTVPVPQARRKRGGDDESDSDDADAADTPTAAGLAVGDVREFIVLYTPAKARFGGLGPAMSARLADEDVLWGARGRGGRRVRS